MGTKVCENDYESDLMPIMALGLIILNWRIPVAINLGDLLKPRDRGGRVKTQGELRGTTLFCLPFPSGFYHPTKDGGAH